MAIKISITIPAFKGRYLTDAIESCLSQSYQNFELIIVDDCSPEDLRTIVCPYIKDNRVRYYRNDKNCGAVNVVDNWNICLGYCTGEYVICMGDDDRLHPNCLEEYVKLINKYPQLKVFHAWTEIIDDENNVFDVQAMRPEFESAWSLWWHRWNPRYKQYIGDFCFDVQALRDCGGFYKLPLAWASDDISALRASLSNGIANTQTICFSYRKNPYTISNSSNNKYKIDAIRQEKCWYDNVLKTLECDSYEDRVLKKLLIANYKERWDIKYAYYLTKDLRNNLLNAIYWYRNHSYYGFSIHILLRAIKNVVLNKKI